MVNLPKVTTAKPLAERAVFNSAILADAVRVIETQVAKNTGDVANLTTEVRLRPGNLYGVQLTGSRSLSPEEQKRGNPDAQEPRSPAASDGANSEVMGRIEEIEFQAETTRNDLNARILALKRTSTSLPPGITAAELQQATVQRFTAITKDLHLLNEELYTQGTKAAKVGAALAKRLDALEEANALLHVRNGAQRQTLDALHATIARLEVAVAPPLMLRPRSPKGVPFTRRSNSPATTYPLSYPSTTMLRGRAPSPQEEHRAKRARTTEEKAFISFGPLPESAETDIKHFELHLRTAIPRFILQALYEVHRDPAYTAHLPITVVSREVAQDLINQWGRHSVRGYETIKMTEMLADKGGQLAQVAQSAGVRNDHGGQSSSRTPQGRAPQLYSEPSRRY
ncbi:hypothetical protein B0H16DRAFT_1759318 [Mycena metata]|uniref:Uncharacterized protein n=1 Tax=Mycena metata TaxID=1033252 RepID=A0AAD7IAT8_9AGAR|nr:hypothetical protein B0H16DRAFT_1759318 [Mycena metata]